MPNQMRSTFGQRRSVIRPHHSNSRPSLTTAAAAWPGRSAHATWAQTTRSVRSDLPGDGASAPRPKSVPQGQSKIRKGDDCLAPPLGPQVLLEQLVNLRPGPDERLQRPQARDQVPAVLVRRARASEGRSGGPEARTTAHASRATRDHRSTRNKC